MFFVLVGVSNSIPIDQPNTSEQNVEAEAAPIGYIPSGNSMIAFFIVRYFWKLYKIQESKKLNDKNKLLNLFQNFSQGIMETYIMIKNKKM